jgi:hypothetical protein
MDATSKTVFISYAREDSKYAERIYKNLKDAGLNPWRDKDAIRPGENWKIAIRSAIKNSRFFIPLFSTNSIEKIGYIQKEFKYALDIFDQFPENKVYIIPVRLNDCQILYEKLEEIQWVDLFPDWDLGLNQIFETFKAQGIEFKQEIDEDNKIKTVSAVEGEGDKKKETEWQIGLSEKDWKDLLTLICKKKCIPFLGTGVYTVQTEDGKRLIPSTKDIIEEWKENYRYPLEDLYKIANIYTLDDSYQLARAAQFLEIQNADEDRMYPKTLLSEMLRKINSSDFPSYFKNVSPYDILAKLDLPLYITTNYDKFMENALSKIPRKKPESDFCKWSDDLHNFVKTTNIPSVFKDTQYKPSEERPLVYHIHGDIETPESMVLTERDYFEFVINLNKGDEKDIIPAFIRQELATSSLMFIGYSLEDINFRAIFQGFLSFLSSLDRKFRKLSIAIQIVPDNYNKKDRRIQKYLEQYTKNMFDVKIFWGTTADFITELGKRWQDFKKNSDMNICFPIKGD